MHIEQHPEVPTLSRRFEVVGMSCSHCELAVAAEVGAIGGVVAVNADAAAGTLDIDTVRDVAVAEVAAAVIEAGYELVG